MRRASWLLVGCLVWSAGFEQVRAEEAPANPPPATPAAAPPPAAATHKVTREPFRIEVKADGVFESAKMTEVILRPEIAANLVVQRAVSHGQPVKKGEPVLWLETDKLTEQIRDADQELAASKVSLRDAESELKLLEAATPLDLREAQRAQQEAAKELAYFLEVREPRSRETAEFSLKNSRFQVEYAEEELKQLEKMYEADDLTEETEEIILKRARRSVESSEFSLRSAEIALERTLSRDLPREREQLQETAQRQNQALDRARVAVPTQLAKKRLEVDKARQAQQEMVRKLAQLKKDLAAMTVRSPADGVVYYGRSMRGKWSEVAKMNEQLRPGGTLAANQTVLTIVALRPLRVRLDLAEKELQHVRPGVAGSVVPAGFAGLRLPAKVAKTSLIPLAPGVFDCELRIETEPSEARVVPGMNGAVTLIAYDKPRAIVVPGAAIFTADDAQDCVYVSQGEGKSEQRVVVVGKRSGDKAEILRGLKEGEEILLQKPSEAKP